MNCEGIKFTQPAKPTYVVYPSRVATDHHVVLTPCADRPGYFIARWHYKGIPRTVPWFVPRSVKLRDLRRKLREHHPCDIIMPKGLLT